MNGEVVQFDIDEELSVLWQKAYCAVRDAVRGSGGELLLQNGQFAVRVDEKGLLQFRNDGGAYDLAEKFDDETMYAVLRELAASRAP